MKQVIVYTRADGGVSVIHPAEAYVQDEDGAEPRLMTLEEIAAKDVPEGLPWRVVDVAALPASRNWRNAWTDANQTETVDVDLEKAKLAHVALMVQKAAERVPADAFGQKDFTQVQAEIAALPVEAAASHEELFNLWPASIDKRATPRTYQMHAEG